MPLLKAGLLAAGSTVAAAIIMGGTSMYIQSTARDQVETHDESPAAHAGLKEEVATIREEASVTRTHIEYIREQVSGNAEKLDRLLQRQD